MNKNQQILLKYLESLIPKDDVLMGLAEFQSRLSEHNAPKEVYIALGMLSNAEQRRLHQKGRVAPSDVEIWRANDDTKHDTRTD